MDHWSRRQFVQRVGVAGLALLAACGRLPGQTPPKVPRIGYLASSTRAGPGGISGEAFRQGLREHGYVEGQNIVIDWRTSDVAIDRLPDLASELVELQPDVLVAATTPPALALKEKTYHIPIVVANAADPIGVGLVVSLARPGSNVTGLSQLTRGVTGKRIELLKDTVPGIQRVAALWNQVNPASALDLQELQDAAAACCRLQQTAHVWVAHALVEAGPDGAG